MSHEVFISHSSKDKVMADAICAGLESRGIRCWIAPRDVLPGQEWTQAIVDAITSSRVFLLVFTENSNQSHQAIKEVDCAINDGITILPFRLEDIKPSGSMKYYLGSLHWLDAITPPLEQHIDELAEYIGRIIETPLSKPAGPVPAPKPASKKSGKGAWLWLVAAGMITVGIITAALILGDKIPFTTRPRVETPLVTSTIDFTPTFTDTVVPPTLTLTVTPDFTVTPEIFAVKMLKEKNCYETNREDSRLVYIFSPGEVVTVSGWIQSGENEAGWFNVRQEGRYGFEDCWIFNSNLEIQTGDFLNLPLFTPRPGQHLMFKARCDAYSGDSETKLYRCDGKEFEGDDDNEVRQEADQWCSAPKPFCNDRFNRCECVFGDFFVD
jgi:hypothetical protein